MRKFNKMKGICFFALCVVFVLLGISSKAEAASTDVSSWGELGDAMADSNIDLINVKDNLTANKKIPINRNMTINFNNKSVDVSKGSLEVAANAVLKLVDVNFFGKNGDLLSGTGEAILTGKVTSTTDNTAGIASMSGGSLMFDAVDLDYDRGTNSTEAIFAKNFTITNKSKVHSEAEKFYGTGKADTGAVIRIDKQSEVVTNSMKGTTSQGNRGQAWRIDVQSDVYIDGIGTKLMVTGDGKQRVDNGGVFLLVASKSTVNINNGAELNIHSLNTSGLLLQSAGGSVNVKNKSKLNIVEDSDNGYALGAALRFRSAGDMTFNIENESEIKVEKLSGDAPAIRMYGGNNKINVSGGSDFIVKNKGDGKPADPGSSAKNQGILYTAGAGNSFNLKDDSSNVFIQAENGAAIDAKGNDMEVLADSGTYFVARGRTLSANKAIYNAGIMQVDMIKPKYYDFMNPKGMLFDNDGSAGKLTSYLNSEASDLSVWNKAKDESELLGNPSNSWTLIDYKLKNTNFSQVDSSTDPKFPVDFGGMPNYSRMTGNNQSAKVPSVRVPTNADKYIYVNVSVPEGKFDEDRPAFDNEVGVRVGLYDENDQEITQLKGRTTTESVYGENEKLGVVKLAIPNGEFIKPGMSVKVLSAWRGSGDENSSKVHMSTQDDILAKEVTAIDVTPPSQVTLESKSITNGMKNLSGTSDQDGAKIFVKNNGQWVKNDQGELITTTVVNGKWALTLPKYLNENDKFEIYAKENMTLDKSSLTYQLPDTYTEEPDGVSGNLNVSAINYDKYKGYHDAVEKNRFASSLMLNVLDIMPPTPQISKIARALTKDDKGNQIPQTAEGTTAKPGEWQGTLTKVNNTLAYRIVVQIPGKTGEEQEKMLYNANITDVIPEGLDFNKDDIKIWKYKKNDTDYLPYRHQDNVLENDGKHKYNMGDIDLEKSEATEILDASSSYDTDSRLLTIGIGDKTRVIDSEYKGDNQYGILLPGDKIVIEIPTKVTAAAVKSDIHNIAKVTGNAGIVKTENPLVYEEVTVESNDAVNPGGKIVGELYLKSAPKNLSFGEAKMLDYNKPIGSDKTSIDQPLIVRDTLKDKDWKVTIKLLEDLTYKEGNDIYTLPDSIYVRYDNKNTTLSLNDTVKIYQSKLSNVPSTQEEFIISDSWNKALDKDGIKMKASKIPKAEKYQGKVEWAIESTQ